MRMDYKLDPPDEIDEEKESETDLEIAEERRLRNWEDHQQDGD